LLPSNIRAGPGAPADREKAVAAAKARAVVAGEVVKAVVVVAVAVGETAGQPAANYHLLVAGFVYPNESRLLRKAMNKVIIAID
jgi:hypothetical protein